MGALLIRQFQSESFFLIYNFQDKPEHQRHSAKAGQHDQRIGIIVHHGSFLGGYSARRHLLRYTGVGRGQNLTDQQREQPQADVLYPKDKGVSRTDDFMVNQFRHRRPQRGRHQGPISFRTPTPHRRLPALETGAK